MVRVTELDDYFNKLIVFDQSLDVGKIDPYMAKGLQVKGKEKAAKIGLGVSA